MTGTPPNNVSGPALGRRQAVLQILREAAGPLPISDIAERLGVHPNTVRFHLDRLLETGRVERVDADTRSPGRPPQLFRSVRSMDPSGPRRYLLLAEVLVHSLATAPNPVGSAIEAGRAWGRRLASMSVDANADQGDKGGGHEGGGHEKDGDERDGDERDGDESDGDVSPDSVDRLVGLLDDLDFAPELRAELGRRQIGLRHCPFLELAQTGAAVVCPVHLGIMQGAMAAWRSPMTVERLDPFVESDLCVAHLATAAAS